MNFLYFAFYVVMTFHLLTFRFAMESFTEWELSLWESRWALKKMMLLASLTPSNPDTPVKKPQVLSSRCYSFQLSFHIILTLKFFITEFFINTLIGNFYQTC